MNKIKIFIVCIGIITGISAMVFSNLADNNSSELNKASGKNERNLFAVKTALKKLGKPEDVARVALFLASKLSDHITGEGIVVSAGEMMSQ